MQHTFELLKNNISKEMDLELQSFDKVSQVDYDPNTMTIVTILSC